MQGFKSSATALSTDSSGATIVEGVTVTANATINVKAATWTTLIASTAYDSYGFWLKASASFTAATLVHILCDIGIGASTAEQVLLPNWMVGSRSDSSNMGGFHFIPLFVPKGTRLSARSQSNVTARACFINIVLHQGNSEGQQIFASCDAYGANTADSGGVAHTASSTRSAKASVGSTLTRDYGAISLGVQVGQTISNSRLVNAYLTIGGGVDMATWLFGVTTSEFVYGAMPQTPINLRLPSGAQLQISMDTNTGGDIYEVGYYCFY